MQRFSMPTMVAVLVCLQVLLAKISKKKSWLVWSWRSLPATVKCAWRGIFLNVSTSAVYLVSWILPLNANFCLSLIAQHGVSGLRTAGLMYWLCRCIAFCSWAVPLLVCKTKLIINLKGIYKALCCFLKPLCLGEDKYKGLKYSHLLK